MAFISYNEATTYGQRLSSGIRSARLGINGLRNLTDVIAVMTNAQVETEFGVDPADSAAFIAAAAALNSAITSAAVTDAFSDLGL